MAAEATAATDGARAAYEHIAPFYDQFTAHHDYELWLGNLLAAAAPLGLRGDRLLDVACGTGKSFLPMLDQGWRVTATDISPAMLERAAAKAGDRAHLHVCDMRQLPRLGSHDLVWCLDDAVNYLLTCSELSQALCGLAANLGEDGLLIFDTNTLLTYRTFFAETQVQATDDRHLIWRGLSSAEADPGCLAEAEFQALVDGVDHGRTRHRQRHFPPEQIEACLRQAGLELVVTFGHGYDAKLERPLDESRHTKAVHFARAVR